VGSRGEGEGSGPGCEACHEVPEHGVAQGFATTISPLVFPAFGARIDVPPSAGIHSLGAAVATTPTHIHAATVGICAFVAEPTHPPSNALRPATTTTSTKARDT
jgi:hypothetical protein